MGLAFVDDSESNSELAGNHPTENSSFTQAESAQEPIGKAAKSSSQTTYIGN